jgi:flagellar M-ring protein FliF
MAEKVSDLLNLFTSPGKGRLVSIGLILILSLVGFGSLIFWNSRPDYQVLFSNLSQEDAGEMINRLKEKKIPMQLSNNGTTLLVPREQVYDIRLSLAAEGLPKGGGVGYEVFDRTNLGTTDFVQKLNYQRALQGELVRTVRQIKEIEHARVHIVTPKESLFSDDQKKPTASVLIKTRSGMTLGPGQVEGIVHLVSSSVEGLEPGSITIVDTSGRILFKRADASPIGQLTTTQLEYQRTIEEELKKKVQGMLEEVLGPSKAIARISTDVDFEQIDITEEKYDPNGVLRSEQKNLEQSSSTSGPPESTDAKPDAKPDGKPEASPEPKGAKGKIVGAGEPATKAAGPSIPRNASSSARQNEIRNYEISKINKRIKSPTGRLRKVSAAVVVDGTYKESSDAKGVKSKQYVPRTQEEIKSLENLVKKAIGYDEERRDQVEVINMPFYLPGQDEEPKAEKTEAWREYLMIGYKPAVSLLLALLFILFIARPLLKGRLLVPARETVPLLETVPQAASTPETPQVVKPPQAISLRDQTMKIVQDDPSKAAKIMKSWLHEKE